MTDAGDRHFSRWRWMMDYCKSRGVSPAHNVNWDRAGRAWEEHQRKIDLAKQAITAMQREEKGDDRS